MSRRTVWIEISREWIEFGVAARGSVDRVHRILVDPDDATPAAGAEDGVGIPNLSLHIAHGLSMLGAPRASVDVLWHAGGSCVDVHTVSAPPAAAESAATLAFTTGNALDPRLWATSARVLDSRKTNQQEHETAVLLSGVRLDVLSEIEQAMAGAGCALRTVVPASATGLLLASHGAMEASSQSTGPRVCLHIGEQSTAIAVASGGALLMARTIELGYATLRQAYVRAAGSEHKSHAEAFLAANSRLLEIDGIPSPKSPDTIAIFEYVRPYLQRLFIEVKQTVRFTLDTDKLELTRATLIGPGAAIPRLNAMLAEEVGFERVDVAPGQPGAPEPGFGITDAARIDAASFGVQPPGLVERQERSGRRAALLYGAVGAAIILAGAAYFAHHRASTFERQARQLDEEISNWREQADAGRGLSPKTLAESLGTLIESESGLRADWGAALAESAALRPNDVRFTSVAGERDRDGSHLQLEALILVDPDAPDPHEQIAAFVQSLQSSGLVKETHLGATEQVQMGDRQCLRFSLGIDLVETRAPWLTAEVSR